MNFCSNCGAQLNEGALFCSNCGAPVATAQKAPEIPVPEPDIPQVSVPEPEPVPEPVFPAAEEFVSAAEEPVPEEPVSEAPIQEAPAFEPAPSFTPEPPSAEPVYAAAQPLYQQPQQPRQSYQTYQQPRQEPFQGYPQPQQQYSFQQPAYQPTANNTPNIPPEYKPLGAWAYFGYNLLFAIPLVGLILLIVFACGGTKRINLRNYARSFFCGLLIAVILLIILVIFLLVAGISLADLFRSYGYYTYGIFK